MASTDTAMQIGFSLEELWRIVRRRILWLLVPGFAGIVLALTLALSLPAVYEAETKILIEAPAIPGTLIESSNETETEKTYHAMKLMILSRDNLGGIIDTFGLYADLEGPLEERIVAMREDVTVERIVPEVVDPRRPLEVDSFRIAYRNQKRAVVPQIANRLADDFRKEHLRVKARVASSTVEFFKAQLEQKQIELGDVGSQLGDYREQHLGELPEQLATNERILDRLTQELAMRQVALEAARNQVHLIRQQLRELHTDGKSERDDPYLRKVVLELALNNDRAAGKTDKHPDVIAKIIEIDELGKIIAERGDEDRPKSPMVASLEGELRNYAVQVKSYESEAKRLTGEIQKYERRIERTPQHTVVVIDLQKTYEHMLESVRTLQLRLTEAQLKHKMEVQQLGERFRIIESAKLPESPVSPNRPLWFVVGSVLGVLSGILLLIVREATDSSFHSADDVQQLLDLPVLAVVPEITLPSERAQRRAKLKRWAGRAAVVLVLLAGGTLAALYWSSRPDAEIKSIVPAQHGTERSDV